MDSDLIHDRGRGPELVGTRITVYNLLPYFLNPAATEEHIALSHSLSIQQVAAARAYVFRHFDEVWAEHLKIEARIAAGNPPEILERAPKTRELFNKFREFIALHPRETEHEHPADDGTDRNGVSQRIQAFRKWLAEQEEMSAV